jgi:hypothetical protein
MRLTHLGQNDYQIENAFGMAVSLGIYT